MKTSFNFLIQSKMLLLCISLIIFPSSESFSAFPTAFHNNIRISTFSSPSTTNLKMGLVENIPTIMDNDISTIFRTLSDLALDIGTAVVSPEETACIKLIESIGQGFGLLSYCASHQCIQYNELIYQAIKISFSFLVLMKTTIPAMRAALHSIIKPEICPLSSRDRHAFEDLFEPIGLSWLHYNTLKYNGAFEWITLDPNKIIILPDFIQDTNTKTNLKDLTQRALEKEIYWLYQGSTNNEYTSNNLVFASNIFGSISTKNPIKERNIKAGDNGATILKINSNIISKLLENDTKLESCIQSLIFIGACHQLNQPSIQI